MPETKSRARNDDAFGFEKQVVNPDQHADQKKGGQNRNDISNDDLPFGKTIRLIRLEKRIPDNGDGGETRNEKTDGNPKQRFERNPAATRAYIRRRKYFVFTRAGVGN